MGCKLDLANEGNRQVSTEEVFDCAAAFGVHYLETSAKSGTNVEEAFQMITQDVYNKIQAGEYKVDDENWDGIKTGFGRLINNNLLEAEPAKGKCC